MSLLKLSIEIIDKYKGHGQQNFFDENKIVEISLNIAINEKKIFLVIGNFRHAFGNSVKSYI